MNFKDLKGGDILYVYTKHNDKVSYDEEIIKATRYKKNKFEILTNDEFWYIPEDFINDCYRIIVQDNLEIHICCDYDFFKEIHNYMRKNEKYT